MLTDVEKIQGLRILLGNATMQVQLLAELQAGGAEVNEQAKTAVGACQLAVDAINESLPAMRKLARKPRGR
jgi:hypothetical protein